MSANQRPDLNVPRSGPGEAQLVGEWARLLLASLRDAGVRDVWVSPGSRSTPFTWAALQTKGLVVRPVLDERAAAFLALGEARVSGRPNALICTSGSAAASYFPAIIEASLAFLPLVVLTCDRPFEVQQAGAAQTIDQLKLFGDHVRGFVELGLPDPAGEALRGLRRSVAQAVRLATAPSPGPVHLNLRARKPLEPEPASSEADHALTAEVTALLARPVARRLERASDFAPEAIEQLAQALLGARSGVIVAGPLPATRQDLAEPVAELARLTGFPILAEATSQLRFALAEHELSCPRFDWVFSDAALRKRLSPELLVCLGQTPTSSAFERWADEQKTRRLVLCEHGAPDALGTAEFIVHGDPGLGLRALVQRLRQLDLPGRPSSLTRELLEADRLCEQLIGSALQEELGLSEGGAVRAVVENMPAGSLLMLGNSLPIRDVDQYVTRSQVGQVTCQRGANGIDGLVSGAIGSAIGSGVPSLLLLGDVSLSHDLGGISALALVQTPLVIAVIDNDGGRIFDQLPVRRLYDAEPGLAEFWRTPQRRDFSKLAALFDLRYLAPTTSLEIQAATTAALAGPGATLLHLRVGPESALRVRQRALLALASRTAGSQG